MYQTQKYHTKLTSFLFMVRQPKNVLFILFLVFANLFNAQPTKTNIINQNQNLQQVYPQVPGYNNTFNSANKVGTSCWNDLDATYTNIRNSITGDEPYSSAYPLDDGSYGPINLGWTYTFYEVDYTSLYINVNGNITFGDLYSAYSASGFPDAAVPAQRASRQRSAPGHE